jgi:hypothetical protein
MQGHAIAGDRQPLATVDALREIHHQGGVEVADLDQAQALLARFAQQTVEAIDMPVVHQYVERHLVAELGHGAADILVAHMRTHQDLAAPAMPARQHLRTHAVGIVQLHLLQAQLAVPHIQSVQQAMGEGHVLVEHAAQARAQVGVAAPCGQARLVLPRGLPRATAEDEEVRHDQMEQR